MNVNRLLPQYNQYLQPLNMHVRKYGPNHFNIAYVKNGRRSYISVRHDPQTKQASLATGATNKQNEGKGIGTALRAIATFILYQAGYQVISHTGIKVGINMFKSPNKYPNSTRIVRRMGYAPNAPNAPSANKNEYMSYWRPTPQSIRNLQNTLRLSYNRMAKLKKNT